MTKLSDTSKTVIHVGMIVLNLDKRLRELFFGAYFRIIRGAIRLD